MKPVRIARWLCAALCAGGLGVEGASGVVGGSEGSIRSAPWSVLVYGEDPDGAGYSCTGSIIDRSHVLTAAHCLYGVNGTLFRLGQLHVVAGVSNYKLGKAQPGDLEQDRGVRSFRIHPYYHWWGHLL